MKAALLLLVVLAVAVIGTLATSAPNCAAGCDQSKCPSAASCKCGTFKDACNCCDVCYKCPGESCVPVFQDKCSGKNTCQLEPGAAILTGATGICAEKGYVFNSEKSHHG
uniref:Putative secreted protein n=1 Tax=Amblyomma triste TaxID=251400 RepID=A0A023GBZ7_AMBTT